MTATDQRVQLQPLVKLILTQDDLEAFKKSEHFKQFWNDFVLRVNEMMKNRPFEQDNEADPAIDQVQIVIQKCQDSLTLFPRGSHQSEDHTVDPTSSKHRFGHVEYRQYHDHLWQKVPEWAADWLCDKNMLGHVLPYFLHSFGNKERIDYGTGHELNFMVFVYGLWRLKMIKMSHKIVTRLFANYLRWMRAIQLEYWLEPAGSHGVWGLDDYQFLPFVFGSAQLVQHQYLRPKDITDPGTAEQYSTNDEKSLLFFESCHFIYTVKKAGSSLAWHSPLLYDISQITAKKQPILDAQGNPTRKLEVVGDPSGWERVNGGLLKMYEAECLSKLPIMQHFLFGRFMGLIGMNDDVNCEKWPVWKSMFSSSDICEFVAPSSTDRDYYSTLNGSHHVEKNNPSENSVEPPRSSQEVIVKWITKQNGAKVPIYGTFGEGCGHNHGKVDTFALGQSFPTCCNMRIPSSIASASSSASHSRSIPFD